MVESGAVPQLVHLLLDHQHPLIQHECAWTLTNVACAEPQYSRHILESNGVPVLVHILGTSRDPLVSSQVLWALANISVDYKEATPHLLSANVLKPLMWMLGIDLPPGVAALSPSPFVMNHVAVVCINLFRGHNTHKLLTHDNLRIMIYALGELLGAPDKYFTCIDNVCSALQLCCLMSAETCSMALEQGICMRLRHLSSSKDRGAREPAIKTLSTIARSPLRLHRRLLCSDKMRGVISIFVNELGVMSPPLTKLPGSTMGEPHQGPTSKVRYEIFRGLRCLMVTDAKYLSEMLQLGLLDHIVHEIDIQEFDVMMQALSCVACVFLNCSLNQLPLVAEKLVTLVSSQLINCTDMELLMELLQGYIRIALNLQSLEHRRDLMTNNVTLLEVMNGLLLHPLTSVAELAHRLVNICNDATHSME